MISKNGFGLDVRPIVEDCAKEVDIGTFENLWFKEVITCKLNSRANRIWVRAKICRPGNNILRKILNDEFQIWKCSSKRNAGVASRTTDLCEITNVSYEHARGINGGDKRRLSLPHLDLPNQIH